VYVLLAFADVDHFAVEDAMEYLPQVVDGPTGGFGRDEHASGDGHVPRALVPGDRHQNSRAGEVLEEPARRNPVHRHEPFREGLHDVREVALAGVAVQQHRAVVAYRHGQVVPALGFVQRALRLPAVTVLGDVFEALQHLVDSQGFPFGRGSFMVYHVDYSLVFRRDPPAANLGSALLTARTYNSRN